ncbi:hypothetical protein L0V05_20090 [Tabrizicola sp. J26]|uniref:hypothetical protein n=1 Tax=Alitabrizicola rongguiensis TaxID=2909234 RepID=UPI001F25C417|nr:hypothetical protein [Tabrizicola rongguiensis]MCF1711112.1 hypothetical protein [Tabrizicola rongguiensis]
MKQEETAQLAVHLVTGILFGMLIISMIAWVPNIGMHEDYFMVPAMTGNEPDLLSWLWSQNNEHRLPVQRLIYICALWLTGDFRSGMVISQGLMVWLSLLLVQAMVKARGGIRLSDVIFPLALLNLGHWENLLWGWQIQFVWSIFLTGLLLFVILRQGPTLAFRDSLIAAVSLCLLPLSGANGIVTACSMVPWAILTGIYEVRNNGPKARRTGRVMFAGALLAVLSSALYFVGYVKPSWSPPLANWPQFVHAANAYFAMAFGAGSIFFQRPLAVLAVLVCLGGGAASLVAFLRNWRATGGRAFGLASFIAAGLALGVLIAAARGTYPYRMPDRYAIFSVMPLLAAFCALELFGPVPMRRFMMNTAAIFFLVFLPWNIQAGFAWRDWWVQGMTRVEADIAANMTIEEVAHRNFPFLLHGQEETLRNAITQLQRAGIGPFALLRPAEQGG